MKLTSYIFQQPIKITKAIIHVTLYTEEENLRCWWKNQTHDWTIDENSLRRKEKHCTKCGEIRSKEYTHPAV